MPAFIRNCVLFILVFLLQTMVFAHAPLRPDLFVVFLVWATARARFFTIIGWGFALGVLLDFFSGQSFFNTVAYTAAAIAMASMPRGVFKDVFSLGLVDVVVGMLVVHGTYAVLTSMFLAQPIFVPWWALIVLIIYDAVIYVLGTRCGGSWQDAL
jgi:hypothetical protein